MQIDRRRELLLKAIPERKKTSKKLKQQLLEEIYNRASSLPQKITTQEGRQCEHSLPRRYGQNQADASNQHYRDSFNRHNQQKYDSNNQRILNRNLSLSRQQYPEQKSLHERKQVNVPNSKLIENYKTKVKKLSSKQEKVPLSQSQQKYRLRTLQQILKKKDSKKMIRETLVSHNLRITPNHQNKLKTKDNKAINLKQAFQNRKFTNLSKYKMSTGSRNNQLFGEKNPDTFKDSNQPSRKFSKENSKKRFKTFKNNQDCEDETFKQEDSLQLKQKTIIKDLNLAEYIDSQNMKFSKEQQIRTLEDLFYQAWRLLNNYTQKLSVKSLERSKYSDFTDLKTSLKLLNTIEKQTGSTSRKTLLLLGKVNYYLCEYNSCIYYLENVFRECKYDLSCINSLKAVEKPENLDKFYSEFFFILADSYKRTENFLCSIKLLDEWEANIVKKYFQSHKFLFQEKQYLHRYKKRTISNLSHLAELQAEDKNEARQFQRNEGTNIAKKRSDSLMRKRSEGYLNKEYSSAVSKQNQRIQSLARKQKIVFKTLNLSLKPRSKHLSIKTLSEINLNLDNEDQTKIIREQYLRKCPQKEIFKQGYLMRARIQFQIKNYYASIQDYQKTLASDPYNLEAGLQLVTLYYKIGRKDKSISFLKEFLQNFKQQNSNNPEPVNQIKYHLAVMLYKCQKHLQSLVLFQQMLREGQTYQFEGQIHFYSALNLINIKKIFCIQVDRNQKQNPSQKETSKSLQQILILLQKSIDKGISQFYIYAAYFLRIYLLIFKLKHYYAAQYEIDRMKGLADRKKKTLSNFKKQKGIQKQELDYRLVSVEPLMGIIRLQDLIQIVSGIICVLKLKLEKGIKLISEVERKVRLSKEALGSDIIAIENPTLNDSNFIEHRFHSNQILKLLYQFKYYGLYTMRKYPKALTYLQKIRQIDILAVQNTYTPYQKDKTNISDKYLSFLDESDRINYLTLQSLVLIQLKNFEDAFKVLKIIETSSTEIHVNKLENRQKNKSTNLQTISTVIELKKQGNTVHIIKSLCYILLYKYLEDQKLKQNLLKQRSSSFLQLKKEEKDSERCESNDQILLVAEDLLSQCLVCDQQNSELLFLISLIHYQLKRYDSGLNYIRQAIELSDDHMIKHYYLKANMKVFLGKFEEAIKDYSNAITVFKEFSKEKQEQKKMLSEQQFVQNTVSFRQYQTEIKNEGIEKSNNETISLSQQTETSQENQNQYYEEEQQMYPEIYLNRAIAYLKHAYKLQYDASHSQVSKDETSQSLSYSKVRQNIINLKSAASQDIKIFFLELKTKIKSETSGRQQNKFQSKQEKKVGSKSPSKNQKQTLCANDQNVFQQNLRHFFPYLQLFLHTPDVQNLLEISRSFSKQFNIKLVSDQELMKYFYVAKQLNNCLLLMQKLIKKYYLSDNNQREEHPNPTNPKKYTQSKALESIQHEPYFKSKRQHKSNKNNNSSQFNIEKYHLKGTLSGGGLRDQKNIDQIQRIRMLIFDKKVLSALKDSSNNTKQDYQNALVTLLQEEQTIRKTYAPKTSPKQFEGGNIFKYSDLIFFIGVIYYQLEDYGNSIRYFEASYSLKKQRNEISSLKKVISMSEESEASEQKSFFEDVVLENMKSFDQIYDNRIFSKEEIEYNIGVTYLLAGDYNMAYDYLQKYDSFVDIIQDFLTQNLDEENFSDKKTKNKLKKIKKSLEESSLEDNSFDEISAKTKTKRSTDEPEQLSDITPFPTHNRLCSIYPQKKINNKKFLISFCLPKIELPLLDIFYSEEVQIAHSIQKKGEQNRLDSSQSVQQELQNSTDKMNFNLQTNIKLSISRQNSFPIKKQNIFNYLDIITLKDIQMRPIAPWIKKDKERKCIRFTDNFLSESFDLKTQCTTERKARNTSRKDMFSQINPKYSPSRNANREGQQKKQKIADEDEIDRSEKRKKKVVDYNFQKIKERTKSNKNRYETIQHQ